MQILEKSEIIRSNEAIREFFKDKGISSKIRSNPRYESILTLLTMGLKEMQISVTTLEAKQWIQEYLTIGQEGDVTYLIPEQQGYDYFYHDNIAIQKIRYKIEEDILKRRVEGYTKEICSVFLSESTYNEDGIEIKQEIKEQQKDIFVHTVLQRVKNRPELLQETQTSYSIKEKKIIEQETNYLANTTMIGLEDFTPSTIELTTNFEEMEPMQYIAIGILQYPKFKITREGIALPLLQGERENILEEYKRMNNLLGRTKAYEKGITKLLMIKDKQQTK